MRQKWLFTSLSFAFGLIAGLAPVLPAGAAPQVFEADCPPTIKCVVVPAAYERTDPTDITLYGNYDIAYRPEGKPGGEHGVGPSYEAFIVHTSEGTEAGLLAAFQDPTFGVSTEFAVAPSGTVYQFVDIKNVPWHAGNWWYNSHAIGIEFIGFMADGHMQFTPEMYRAGAELLKHLSPKTGIKLNRQTVIGHDEVPADRQTRVAGMHVDPGPFWNWERFMRLLGAPVTAPGGYSGKMVTIAPPWRTNRQVVEGCGDRGPCVPAGGPHESNFAYVRTAASLTAPLITDPILGQGTTQVLNTTARVRYGQQYALASSPRYGDGGIWYNIWFAGTNGWVHSPFRASTAFLSRGLYATPKAGLTEAALYGKPIPELSEVPEAVRTSPYVQSSRLTYRMLAGQRYAVADLRMPTDYYHRFAYDGSLPYDETNFHGATKYVQVQYNGRLYFVKKSDVNIVRVG